MFDGIWDWDSSEFKSIHIRFEVTQIGEYFLYFILFTRIEFKFSSEDRSEPKFKSVSNQALCVFNLSGTVKININWIAVYKIRLLCIYYSWKAQVVMENSVIDLNVITDYAILMENLDAEGIIIGIWLTSLVEIEKNE